VRTANKFEILSSSNYCFPRGLVVVAEGNCSGCQTTAGWFIVVELRPLFTKRVGMLTIKARFVWILFRIGTHFTRFETVVIIIFLFFFLEPARGALAL
jgi:hypothetical protein